MSTPQESKPTWRWPAAFNAVRPRELIFLGVALVVIVLQLLAMDWVVLSDVDHAQTKVSQRMALKSESSQLAQASTGTTGVSSDEAQSPQGVGTVPDSPER
ncbi:MAG: hypothetical protein ACREWJ_09005 [Rhodoferax sp.]